MKQNTSIWQAGPASCRCKERRDEGEMTHGQPSHKPKHQPNCPPSTRLLGRYRRKIPIGMATTQRPFLHRFMTRAIPVCAGIYFAVAAAYCQNLLVSPATAVN